MAPEIKSSFVKRRPAYAPLVLIVEDAEEIRDLYCTCLEFHGFRTEAAADGLSGLALAQRTKPDAIVLDFAMPRMDGAEVLRRLKLDDDTRPIPVVMITAAPELVGLAVRAACAAFLEKPCEPDEFVEAIAKIFAWTNTGSPGDVTQPRKGRGVSA